MQDRVSDGRWTIVVPDPPGVGMQREWAGPRLRTGTVPFVLWPSLIFNTYSNARDSSLHVEDTTCTSC